MVVLTKAVTSLRMYATIVILLEEMVLLVMAMLMILKVMVFRVSKARYGDGSGDNVSGVVGDGDDGF